MAGLKKILSTTSKVGIFSFLSLEIIFYYFWQQGVSKYPENVIIPIVVLTVDLFLGFVFSYTIGLLTFYFSAIGTVFLVDWVFSNSPEPAILPYGANSVLSLPVSGFLWERFTYDIIFVGFLGASLLLMAELSSAVLILALYAKIRNLPIGRQTISEKLRGIVTYFDKHTWIVPILIAVVVGVIGYILGRQ